MSYVFNRFERSVCFDFVVVKEGGRADLRFGRLLNATVTYGVGNDGRPYGRALVGYGLSGEVYDAMLVGPGVAGKVDWVRVAARPLFCDGASCAAGHFRGCGHGGCGAAQYQRNGFRVFATSTISEALVRGILSISVEGPEVEGSFPLQLDMLGRNCTLSVNMEELVALEDVSVFDEVVRSVVWPWQEQCVSARCLHAPVNLDACGMETIAVWSDHGVRYIVGDPTGDLSEDEVIEIVVAGDGDVPGPPPGTLPPLSNIEVDVPPPYEEVVPLRDPPGQTAGVPPLLEGGRYVLSFEEGGFLREFPWRVVAQSGRGGRDDVRMWRVAASEGLFELVERLESLASFPGESRGVCVVGPPQYEHVRRALTSLFGPLHPVRPPSGACGLVLSPRWFGVLRVALRAIEAVPEFPCGEAGRWGPWLIGTLSVCGSDSERARLLLAFLSGLFPFLNLSARRQPVGAGRDWRHYVDAFMSTFLADNLYRPTFTSEPMDYG